jgi:prevent-host-death family protein
MVKATSRTVHHEFGKYLDLAHAGQQVVITKRGKPWATLAPVRQARARKVVWPDIVARASVISGGRQSEAVANLLRERENER